MLEKVSEHIASLMCSELAVRKQFEADQDELDCAGLQDNDPLQEDEHEAVRGLIHKYSNRVLCLMTAECAAYCRFCTRRRIVSDIDRGRIAKADIDHWVEYLTKHPEVSEAILSGGDPFTVSDEIFQYALQSLMRLDSIKLMRIGTRAPVSAPDLVNEGKLRAIESLEKTIYVGINFEHPSELTQPTLKAVRALRKSGAILYSQSVFLRGVNDDYETLYELFSRLLEIGVRPYYIYHCDPVPGVGHFIVDIERERDIMTRLRSSLSGLACPLHVIDTPQGSGKIPVPANFWDADTSHYRDFAGDLHSSDVLEENTLA